MKDRSQHTVFFIPARNGSKGIPGKNMRILAGRPLIMWSIGHCLAFNRFRGTRLPIVVSTDDGDISRALLDEKEVTVDPRPEHLAGDRVTTEEVLLEWWDRNPHILRVILLQATSPVRTIELMSDVHAALADHDSVVVLAESNPHVFSGDLDGRFTKRYLRQERPIEASLLHDTGNMYGIKRAAFMSEKDRLCGNLGIVMVRHKYEAIEIDDAWDVPLAEVAMRIMEQEFGPKEEKRHAKSNLS